MNTNHTACMDCGVLFASSINLQFHVKRGCPEAEDDDEDDDSPPLKKWINWDSSRGNKDDKDSATESLDDSDDAPAFQALVDKAYDAHADQFHEKVNRFIEDDMETNRAEREAHSLLRP